MKESLNGILAKHTNQPIEKIAENTERDYFMGPDGAKEFGLIDRILTSRKEVMEEK